jgi:hypothetical protein
MTTLKKMIIRLAVFAAGGAVDRVLDWIIPMNYHTYRKAANHQPLKEDSSTQPTSSKQKVISRQQKLDAAFQRLVAYKNEYGHCNVPRCYNDAGGSPNLGCWLDNQRTGYKKGSLSQERIGQLESIGIIWKMEGEDLKAVNRDDETWESIFQRRIYY